VLFASCAGVCGVGSPGYCGAGCCGGAPGSCAQAGPPASNTARNAASVARVSCPRPLAAAVSVDRTAYAQLADCSAFIRFKFIVFFTPRLVVFTEPVIFMLTCTTFSTHNLFQSIIESRAVVISKDRPRESGSLAGACIG
jgi:hypothetical protein